jgi:hypothetical protein
LRIIPHIIIPPGLRVKTANGNFLRQHLLQTKGILGGIPGFIVVKVAEYLLALSSPGRDDFGPAIQGSGVIVPLVRTARPVESNVDKVGGDFATGDKELVDQLKTAGKANSNLAKKIPMDIINTLVDDCNRPVKGKKTPLVQKR